MQDEGREKNRANVEVIWTSPDRKWAVTWWHSRWFLHRSVDECTTCIAERISVTSRDTNEAARWVEKKITERRAAKLSHIAKLEKQKAKILDELVVWEELQQALAAVGKEGKQ